MSVIILKDEMLENEVMNADKPVLIDFFATWCGPCRMVSPIVDEIAEEHSEFKICKLTLTKNLNLHKIRRCKYTYLSCYQRRKGNRTVCRSKTKRRYSGNASRIASPDKFTPIQRIKCIAGNKIK